MPAPLRWEDDQSGRPPSFDERRPPSFDERRPRAAAPRPVPPMQHTQPDHRHARPERYPPRSPAPTLEGLTAGGGAAIALVTCGTAAVLDALMSPGLGWFFLMIFVLASLFVGL